MNSQKRTLIAAGAVLVLLAAVMAVLLLTQPEETPVEVIESPEVKTRLLYDISPQKLNTLTIKNETGELVLERVDTSDTEYFFAAPQFADLPQSIAMMRVIADAASSLTAEEIITENAADLSVYGLSSPKAEFTANFSDSNNTVKHLLIGNETPAADAYYAAFAGESTVYTIKNTSVGYFSDNINQVIDRVIYKNPLTPEEMAAAPAGDNELTRISKMTISRHNLPYTIEIDFRPISIEPEGAQAGEPNYGLVSPIKMDVDDEKGQPLMSAIFGFTATDVEMLYPTAEDLDKYGLSDPFTSVTMILYDGPITLKIGETYGDGRYCLVDGVDVVWKIANDKLPWATVLPLGVANGVIFRSHLFGLNSIDITGSGIDDKIAVVGTNDEDLTVTLNGKPADAAKFKQLYNYIILVPAGDVYIEPVEAEPNLSIVMKGAKLNESADFYDIGNRRYAVAINGEIQYSCTAAYYDLLVENIKAFETNGEINLKW
ncbi:MAG: DUF4340 domain-containing protein [Ruminococcus sp.]|jgi:hypothetical protein|nr:DUF4340 domain-containing protein [Ruminococcus sp.]